MMTVLKDRHPQYLVDENGEKQGVLLSIEEYEELLENLSDLAVAAERREEETVSHEEVLKELRDDGLQLG